MPRPKLWTQFTVHLMMVHLLKWLTCSIMVVLSCWAIRYWSKIKLIRGSSEGDVSTWEKSWSGTITLICGVEGAIVITAFLRRCWVSHASGFWWPGMEGDREFEHAILQFEYEYLLLVQHTILIIMYLENVVWL